MRKIIINKKQKRQVIKESRLITESTLKNKTIISVDIQPEYQSHIHFLNDWIKFLNKSYKNNKIVFLYNGESLGFSDENEYKWWLSEIGLKDEVLDYAEFWDDFSARYNHGEIRDLLEFSSDMINIPDLMDYIKYFNNVILLGGGITECLKEVELAFMALNKPYNILKEFTY